MTAKDFGHIFNALYLPLGMYALRMVGNTSLAEDIVQEAFAKTWESIQSGREIDNPKAWLYRAVRNGSVDWLRRRRETVDLSLADAEVLEEAIDTSERDARVWRAIDSLPERCREIFLMSKRDGLTNAEIADELGLSVKTVKNQMTKALSRIQEVLSADHRPFFLPFL